MTWTTLGTALENALASMMNDGEGAAATAYDAVKKPASTEVPAVVTGQRQGEEKPDGDNRDREGAALLVSRNMDRANPTRSPSAARSIFLVIDNEGGRPAQGGGGSRAAYRAQAGGGVPRRELLKLVVG